MGAIVFKQPNGKYARWSGIVDAFTFWNATKEEYIEQKVEDLREELENDFKQRVFERYNLDDIIKAEGYSIICRAILEGDIEADVYTPLKDMGASPEQIELMRQTEKKVREDLLKKRILTNGNRCI